MKSQFIESIRRDIRLRGYSIRTEKGYLYWIKYFIRFNQKTKFRDRHKTIAEPILVCLGDKAMPYYLLPITYYLLPITYYLLPIT